MNCNIIKDLIPLYIDECCSHESSQKVKKHLNECSECKSVFESMTASVGNESAAYEPKKISRINDWKASVMQSVLLFVSFGLITIGVALEAATPSGFGNGYWAFNLVIPSTGFMLSLANWYFVRLYKNRKTFSWCSCALLIFITACAGVWAGFHYEFSVFDFIEAALSMSATDFLELIAFLAYCNGPCIVLTLILAATAKISSNAYAKMLGKE